ncbi:hypothetical protein WG904_12745 [Pedobacter sp. Du54]|uniref:baeRF3 domain-containing protein n=1 Tax=Pedobacter anseongensis TaxID=3133439 RepID=UPI0030A638ED
MQANLTPDLTEVMGALPNRPAVSIILPIEPTFSFKSTLLHKFKTIVDRVGRELSAKYPKEVESSVMEKLRSIIATINVDIHKKGIAIFVSQNFEKSIFLDVPIKERIIINDTFEVRDLVQNDKLQDKYLILLLSGRNFKLYQGSTHQFLKVISSIPQSIFAYQRDLGEEPFGHTALSERKEVLMDKFLHQVDREIGRLIAINHLPVFVLGTTKVLGHFKKLTKNSDSIAAYISGNYDKASFAQLQELLRPYLMELKINRQAQLLTLLDQAADQRKLAVGINEVWQAALGKRGQKLVVESDFMSPILLDMDKDEMLIGSYPGSQQAIFTPDVVDDIIAKVIAYGGDVDFTEHNFLDKYQHIALITH